MPWSRKTKMRVHKIKNIKLLLLLVFTLTPFYNSYADEESTYNFKWLDDDKEVYVLQNREFRKKGRIYLALGGGITTSTIYTDSKVVGLRAGNFFSEDWGIEVLYSLKTNSENDEAKLVRQQQVIPFIRSVTDYTGLMIMWSPFYSKINTFNSVLYFDVMFGLGAARISTENNLSEFVVTGTTEKNESHVGLMWDVAINVFMTKTFSLRLDLTTLYYFAEFPNDVTGSTVNSKDDVRFSNYDLSLSLVTFF